MEKQLLDNTQISAVLKIVKRDIFHNLYTQAIDEIKNGEEWIDKELSITNRIDEINKTAELLNKKITKINEDNKDLTGCWNKLCIPGVMSTTTEVIEQIILRSLNNKYNINGEVISKYKIDHFDQNRFNEVGDFAEIEESYEESNSHIEKYISHIQYDYLPHFLLPYNNEEINKEEIF